VPPLCGRPRSYRLATRLDPVLKLASWS
jgi:hypothetical protein